MTVSISQPSVSRISISPSSRVLSVLFSQGGFCFCGFVRLRCTCEKQSACFCMRQSSRSKYITPKDYYCHPNIGSISSSRIS